MSEFSLDNYVHALAGQVRREFACEAANAAELKTWQTAFRARLREILGLGQIEKPGRCLLQPRQVGEESFDAYLRQEWVICSEAGFEVPFFLLLPRGATVPRPLVLTPHGHGKEGKEIYVGIWRNETAKLSIAEGQRDIALQAVEAGYAVIAPDMRGFAGLRLQKDRDEDNCWSCRTMQMHAQLFGRTLIGERVWDIERLIDYAETRPDIDTSRIAITGNSGGGAVALFAAACDERIGVAAPSCYFCEFENSIGSIHHCECNYIPGIMTLAEMYDVAGLIAPRPFLAVAGRDDPLFPVTSAEYAYKKLKTIYEVAGAGDLCKLYVGDGGHRYYKEPVWEFIGKAFAMNPGGQNPARNSGGTCK